jgi:hypothetical protein
MIKLHFCFSEGNVLFGSITVVFFLCFRNVRNCIVSKKIGEHRARKREHIFIYHHDTEF